MKLLTLLQAYRFKHGVYDGVYDIESDEAESNLKHEEIMELLAHKELELLKIIKNCTVFFVALAILAIGISAMALIFVLKVMQ